jgi:GTPase SAR1 family protein
VADDIVDSGSRDIFFVTGDTLRKLLPTAFQRCAYDVPQIEDNTRTATAGKSTQHQNYFPSSTRAHALVRWRPNAGPPVSTTVWWIVFDISGGQRRPHPQKTAELGESLRIVISNWLNEHSLRQREAPRHDPIVGPGERFEEIYTGTLRDYSGCATELEVADLTSGELPLGKYAFGFQSPPQRRGAPLYLSRFRDGSRMEYNGVLVCAPQNSGKTTLISRWAQAATSAKRPYAVFVIDVKGNLRGKLTGRIAGDVFCFSTDPHDETSDRINFLDGPLGLDAAESDRLHQLATALLPSRGFVEQGGQDEYFYRNRVIWLTAFIHLLKLAQCYYPEWFTDDEGGERNVDLCDLYELVADEEQIYAYIAALSEAETILRERGETLPACGVDHWASELAILLSPDRISIGQRPPRDSLRTYTTGILSALEPFSRHGTLHQRVRSYGPGRLFDIEATLGGAPRPVTVILAARQQDLDKSDAVLSMTIRRLQWFLFDRMTQPEAEQRPVLLLLDETRRIRDFNAVEYVTFAREAKAACVIVYQALDQIGEPARITELLENVGTQIYLGSLVGNTARYFMSILPRRRRPVTSCQIVRSSNTETITTTTTHEHVDYLGTTDLFQLPAGSWPALVYINDQPRRKPFLVDMTDTSLAHATRKPIVESAATNSPAPWESGWTPRTDDGPAATDTTAREIVVEPTASDVLPARPDLE